MLILLLKRKNNYTIDISRGYTTAGIHRDDFEIYINDSLLNIYGSQGQHRTAILALKIAEIKKKMRDDKVESPH